MRVVPSHESPGALQSEPLQVEITGVEIVSGQKAFVLLGRHVNVVKASSEPDRHGIPTQMSMVLRPEGLDAPSPKASAAK